MEITFKVLVLFGARHGAPRRGTVRLGEAWHGKPRQGTNMEIAFKVLVLVRGEVW